MTQQPEQPVTDPHTELNDMHKLIEELKAENQVLQSKLSELQACISQHHKEVFKK